jgi:hypothetical protein
MGCRSSHLAFHKNEIVFDGFVNSGPPQKVFDVAAKLDWINTQLVTSRFVGKRPISDFAIGLIFR